MNSSELAQLIKQQEEAAQALENAQVHVYNGGIVLNDSTTTTTITSDGKIINSDGQSVNAEDVISEKKNKKEEGSGPDDIFAKKKKLAEDGEDD